MLSVQDWAAFTFSRCELGDKRRTNRLVKTLANLASSIGQSIVKSSPTDADIEGTYRLIRNDNVTPAAIAEGGFAATAEMASTRETLLAIEDSTSLGFTHGSRKELGYISNTSNAKSQGFAVHSVMLYDPDKGQTLGLIEQQRWVRDEKEFGKRKKRAQTPYEEKESYKWVKASEAVSTRLKEYSKRCISVCDREADIIEYLAYKHSHKQRFLVRATFNRPLEGEERLFDYMGTLEEAGEYKVMVPQRGGRTSRIARMSIRFAPVKILAPSRKRKEIEPFEATAILCEEQSSQGSPLKWLLLTSELASNSEQARQIVSYYEARWKIEIFHKVWKSEGTDVENIKMQSAENMERMAVILAFAAMRVFQLKEYGDSVSLSKESCTTCLPELHWKLLWRKMTPKKAFPKSPPDMKWAYHSVGKLGGWKDSKRTGRVGYSTLWEGWYKLETLVEGYNLSLDIKM